MKWYNDMTEQQKQNFKKVITICVVGAILILLIPMVWYFNNRNLNYKPNGTILLQDLYADIPYTEENKEKYLDYINNQENVDRERFKSIYEN